MIRFLRAVTVVGLFTYCVFLATLYFLQDRLIFPSPSIAGRSMTVPGFKPVELTTADGEKLRAYFHAAENDEATIIVFHGNGDLAMNQHFKADKLQKAGFGVLLAEYRGYGGSSGTPTETGLHEDARTACKFVQKTSGTPIGIYAHSLGSGVGTRLAGEQDIFAMVLEAPFDSMLAIAQSRYSWLLVKWFLKHPFHSDKIFPGLKLPILILHGEKDQIMAL